MFCFVKQKHRVILSSYTVFLEIIGYEVICLLLRMVQRPNRAQPELRGVAELLLGQRHVI